MIKVVSIFFLEDFKILCVFNNGEKKVLDLMKKLDPKNKFTQKILSPVVFKKASIGSFGEITWQGEGEMKDLQGKILSCEYDISPEFAYYNSEEI